MNEIYYIQTKVEGLTSGFANEGAITIGLREKPNCPDPLYIAYLTMKLAVRLGVHPPTGGFGDSLPYSDTNDKLVFDAPLASLICGRPIRFLRGWKQYESCIKGFNSLGLLVEHANLELQRFNKSKDFLTDAKREFLASRKKKSERIFSKDEINSLFDEQLDDVDEFDVALWKAFAHRTIFCSTSSNMGVSLHEALRHMQQAKTSLIGKEYSILNDDEGSLVVWCPDEEADFMNPEKTQQLKHLAAETPPLTSLTTYINRKQRDPGALKNTLETGGYFFPTNPQSREEIQNLIAFSMDSLSREWNKSVVEILNDSKVLTALTSLGCETTQDGRLTVLSAVEGGMFGMCVAYLILVEETLQRGGNDAISTYNQASIAAALAAAVLADMYLRNPETIRLETKEKLREFFPLTIGLVDNNGLAEKISTRIHGVFDIANLQSLAQLFGVVVERHLSGRGTAFVGLGSSSYASGNLCYKILRRSERERAGFRGKQTLHAATHTINPVAQAVIYGEELYRALSSSNFPSDNKKEQIDFVMKHAVKPEPAGAASVAGYLLARMDSGTLSLLEIAFVLRLIGFDSETFLRFSGISEISEMNPFTQEGYEEGQYMGQFSQNLLIALDWELDKLEALALEERRRSCINYEQFPLDDQEFESKKPLVNLYLTGDNTTPPDREFVRLMIDRCLINLPKIKLALKTIHIP